MSYRTILVHADKSRNAHERIRLAAMLALTENAHLTGVAITGISRYLYQAGLINDNDPNLTTHLLAQLDMLREAARDTLNDFEQIIQTTNVKSSEAVLVDDDTNGGINRLARCNDLLVIGQTDPQDPSPDVMPEFPETLVINSGRPVLIVPYAGRFDSVGSAVLIGWDGSVAATRAVANAMPILRRAETVEVAIFNPAQEDDKPSSAPGTDIVSYLRRHDVKAHAMVQNINIDVGSALLSAATDLNSDLIVMGGFGHSRFREMLLGGVTRTILKSMTIPVLMSH